MDYNSKYTGESLEEQLDKVTELSLEIDKKVGSRDYGDGEEIETPQGGVGSELSSIIIVDKDGADLSFADGKGNVIAEFANGHVKTQRFDSSKSAGLDLNGAVISFVGDSIAAGAQGGAVNAIVPEERWSKVFSDLANCTENNIAVSGKKFAEVGGYALRPLIANMDTRAKAIFVAAGTNDWAGGDAIGDAFSIQSDGTKMPNTTLTTFSGGIHATINAIRTKKPTIKIYFISPIKRNNARTKNSAGLYLEDYVKVMREICEYYSIPLIDMFSESQMDATNADLSALYLSDGIHPNKKGYEYYGKFVYNYFKHHYFE